MGNSTNFLVGGIASWLAISVSWCVLLSLLISAVVVIVGEVGVLILLSVTGCGISRRWWRLRVIVLPPSVRIQ